MRDSHRLSLKRETLTQLTSSEMTAVAGGSHLCGITDACTDGLTHGPSIDASCPTIPPTTCFAIETPASRFVCL